MDVSTALIFVSVVATLSGPRVWQIVGGLPGLIQNASRNLCDCGGTSQTCTCPLPFLARKQGVVTVSCDPMNLEHILKAKFDNYRKGPTWQAAFHDLLGDGIFNSDGNTWVFQRKTAALEFKTRTLRPAMARWVSRVIKFRFCPILKAAQVEGRPVDLQDLLLRLTFDNICGLTIGKDPQTLSLSLPENAFEICDVLLETRDSETAKWFDEPLAFEEVDRFIYLKAALSETLRMYPSGHKDSKRVVANDVLPSGTFVPSGSAITYSIYLVGRMSTYGVRTALSSSPSGGYPPTASDSNPPRLFRFVSFNAGPSICLGKDLTYIQMKSIAATVLLRHRLAVVRGHRVEQKMSLTLFMKRSHNDIHKKHP